MDSDNDAAQAGLDEVSGHIQVLNARLAQLRKNGTVTSALESPLEDLQDYYERAVQLRTMRITTLEEEKGELGQRAAAAMAKVRRFQALLVVCVLGLLGAVVEHASPGTTVELVGEYWSHALIGIVVAFVMKRCA
jgi:hypothetical protein